MTPIVDRLETQYSAEIAFVRLNARDNDLGQRTFDMAALPGHPAFLILQPNGSEAWRHVGPVEQGMIDQALRNALGQLEH
jgi:hypothetical protein